MSDTQRRASHVLHCAEWPAPNLIMLNQPLAQTGWSREGLTQATWPGLKATHALRGTLQRKSALARDSQCAFLYLQS